MPWVKKGVIFETKGEHWWNKTHAQVPTIDVLDNDVFRVYYATRDEKGRSHTSYFEVSAEDPSKVLYQHQDELLPLGKIGDFDDCGVMPSSIINYKGKKYFYYLGWNVTNTVPYRIETGLAISSDGGKSFNKAFAGPVLARGLYEGVMCASGDVYYDQERDLLQIWYTSGTGYITVNDRVEPLYRIGYRESKDGIHWEPREKPALPYKNDHECHTRPCVLVEDGIYKMWYTYRDIENYRTDPSKSYRIGYAQSQDGIDWERMDDKVGIAQSETGWDSEMIAYPCVVKYKDKKYMFYNGNGFGQSGIGYAEYE